MAKNKDITPEEDMAAHLLLQEVDEAMYQDKLYRIWEEWGSTIIGVALMIIFGTMIGVGWRGWRDSVHSSQTQALLAVQQGEMQQAESLDDHYNAIAALLQAGAVAGQNNQNAIGDMVYQKMMDQAAQGDMTKEWEILAQWGALRAKATGAKADDLVSIADSMAHLSQNSTDLFGAYIAMEAGIFYGEGKAYDQAFEMFTQALDQAKDDDNASLIPVINQYQQIYQAEAQ